MALTIDTRTDEQDEWDGANHRVISDRRIESDRREDIRFELDKKNRRISDGRRKEDQNPWHKPHD